MTNSHRDTSKIVPVCVYACAHKSFKLFSKRACEWEGMAVCVMQYLFSEILRMRLMVKIPLSRMQMSQPIISQHI